MPSPISPLAVAFEKILVVDGVPSTPPPPRSMSPLSDYSENPPSLDSERTSSIFIDIMEGRKLPSDLDEAFEEMWDSDNAISSFAVPPGLKFTPPTPTNGAFHFTGMSDKPIHHFNPRIKDDYPWEVVTEHEKLFNAMFGVTDDDENKELSNGGFTDSDKVGFTNLTREEQQAIVDAEQAKLDAQFASDYNIPVLPKFNWNKLDVKHAAKKSYPERLLLPKGQNGIIKKATTNAAKAKMGKDKKLALAKVVPEIEHGVEFDLDNFPFYA